jgi:hypothetical protein
VLPPTPKRLPPPPLFAAPDGAAAGAGLKDITWQSEQLHAVVRPALQFLTHFCRGDPPCQEVVFGRRMLLLRCCAIDEALASECLMTACRGSAHLARKMTYNIPQLCAALRAAEPQTGLLRFLHQLCETDAAIGMAIMMVLLRDEAIVRPCNTPALFNRRWAMLGSQTVVPELEFHRQTIRLVATITAHAGKNVMHVRRLIPLQYVFASILDLEYSIDVRHEVLVRVQHAHIHEGYRR